MKLLNLHFKTLFCVRVCHNINTTFATSCYPFFCPLHERAQALSVAAHVLDLVQAPLQLLTIPFLLNQDQFHYWAVMRLRGRAAKSQMSSFTFYGGESPFLPAHSRTYNLKLVPHTPETRRQQGTTAHTLANGHQRQTPARTNGALTLQSPQLGSYKRHGRVELGCHGNDTNLRSGTRMFSCVQITPKLLTGM